MSDSEDEILTDEDESFGNERRERWCRKFYHPQEEQPGRQDRREFDYGLLRSIKNLHLQQTAGQQHMEGLQQMQREDRQYMTRMREDYQKTWAEDQRRFRAVEEVQEADHQKIQQLEQGHQNIQGRVADIEQILENRNQGPLPGPAPVPRCLRARGAAAAAGPAPAGARAPPEAHRTNKAYTEEECVRMVGYLIENDKIGYAKSLDVWKDARIYDPVLAGRTAEALAHRFRTHVWQNVMRGRYNVDPQTLAQFRGIWPGKPF